MGARGERALAANVNVHGPAARSLTTAAIGGALKERKLGFGRKGFSSKRFGGSEPEAKTSPK